MAALQGKVALVTVLRRPGAETSGLFSRQGATVFGIGRDTGRLADVFADVESGSYAAGGRCFAAGLHRCGSSNASKSSADWMS